MTSPVHDVIGARVRFSSSLGFAFILWKEMVTQCPFECKVHYTQEEDLLIIDKSGRDNWEYQL